MQFQARTTTPTPHLQHPAGWQWDVFCRVIDNHGDLGVLWRLSCQLADRGHAIRLWVDDASALSWMAPTGHAGVTVHSWAEAEASSTPVLPAADGWIEGFGCEVPTKFIANNLNISIDEGQNNLKIPHWINLEYLTAEPYAERCHWLPSPVMSGPGRGATKRFFYPGFTLGTGGLLRELDLLDRQARFDRGAWLTQHLGLADWSDQETLISLFCYEPSALSAWAHALAHQAHPTRVLVAPGRPQAAWQQVVQELTGDTCAQSMGNLHWHMLPHLTQQHFDHLLWACDHNMVRGEDSVVRALWANRPFTWHIYPQDDDAHLVKLDAFLQWSDAPEAVRNWHHLWNAKHPHSTPLNHLDWAWNEATQHASAWASSARHRLLDQEDLVTQLLNHLATPN